MIHDESGRVVAPPPPPEPASIAALEALATHETVFVWDPERAGIDLLTRTELPTGPNRARIKLFSPRPGTAVIFIYKDSQIPFSKDRFTYGALITKGEAYDEGDFRQLIAWLESGLHPEHRPRRVKRAFPFDVPR